MAPFLPHTLLSFLNTSKPMDKFFKYRSLWNSDGHKISVGETLPPPKKNYGIQSKGSWKFLRHASSSYNPASSFCFLLSCLSIFRKSHSSHFIGRSKHTHIITYKYSMFIFAYDLKEHTKRKNNKNKLMSSREQDRARSWNPLAGGQHSALASLSLLTQAISANNKSKV